MPARDRDGNPNRKTEGPKTDRRDGSPRREGGAENKIPQGNGKRGDGKEVTPPKPKSDVLPAVPEQRPGTVDPADNARAARDLGNRPRNPIKSRNEDVNKRLAEADHEHRIQIVRDQAAVENAIKAGKVIPVRVGPNGVLNDPRGRIDLTQIKNRDELNRINSPDDFARALGRQNAADAAFFRTVQFNRLPGRFQTRLADHHYDRFSNFGFYNRYNLGRQYSFYNNGDIARRMNLLGMLAGNGGWGRRYYGPVNPFYYNTASFSYWYAGPGIYPRYTWFPYWRPWVRWSWWNTVPIVYDPRPIFVRPIYCNPSPVWAPYAYPQWAELPVVTSGTWVDVPPINVAQGNDVQLLAVRFVDSGHPEEELGPRYRVWLRNNSPVPIDEPFSVILVASNDEQATPDLPQAGVMVEHVDPNQTVSVDIRLPYAANFLADSDDGRKEPFHVLQAIVDGNRVLNDVAPENNGAILERNEILPVDPAAFSTDTTVATPGMVVSLAGEGLGPEPGRVIITADGKEYEPQIYGWYDLGVQFKVPDDLTGSDIDVLVIRGDGAATNPVPLSVTKQDNYGPAIGYSWDGQQGN